MMATQTLPIRERRSWAIGVGTGDSRLVCWRHLTTVAAITQLVEITMVRQRFNRLRKGRRNDRLSIGRAMAPLELKLTK